MNDRGKPSGNGTTTVLLASGSNARGQLGNNSSDDSHVLAPCSFSSSEGTTRSLLPNARISQLVSGANHTVLALSYHDKPGVELWCCGDGSKGQLGPAHATSTEITFCPLRLPLDEFGFTGYHPRLVAAAWETTYVVISCEGRTDVVLSMGADDWGDLGIGDSFREALNAVNLIHLVDGSSVSPEMIRLVIKSMVAGPHHVLVHAQVLPPAEQLECFIAGWGSSRHGQLGLTPKNLKHVSIPKCIEVDAKTEMIASVALGNQHTVLLHSSGQVLGLGSNRKSQLQGLETLSGVKEIACTWNGTYALVDGFGIFSAGSNEKGQLGRSLHSDASLGRVQFPNEEMHCRVKRLACGSEHVLCIVGGSEDTDEVWGWGWNEHGNLGLGTTTDALIPVKIWSSSQELTDAGQDIGRGEISGIWAGCGTSWIAVNY